MLGITPLLSKRYGLFRVPARSLLVGVTAELSPQYLAAEKVDPSNRLFAKNVLVKLGKSYLKLKNYDASKAACEKVGATRRVKEVLRCWVLLSPGGQY
jgi:hypothetical protein